MAPRGAQFARPEPGSFQDDAPVSPRFLVSQSWSVGPAWRGQLRLPRTSRRRIGGWWWRARSRGENASEGPACRCDRLPSGPLALDRRRDLTLEAGTGVTGGRLFSIAPRRRRSIVRNESRGGARRSFASDSRSPRPSYSRFREAPTWCHMIAVRRGAARSRRSTPRGLRPLARTQIRTPCSPRVSDHVGCASRRGVGEGSASMQR